MLSRVSCTEGVHTANITDAWMIDAGGYASQHALAIESRDERVHERGQNEHAARAAVPIVSLQHSAIAVLSVAKSGYTRHS